VSSVFNNCASDNQHHLAVGSYEACI